MSLSVVHVYGFSNDNPYIQCLSLKNKYSKLCKKNILLDRIPDEASRLLLLFLDRAIELPKGKGFDDVLIFDGEWKEMYVGILIDLPWKMKVKTKKEANAQLTSFLEYYFKDIDEHSVTFIADEYFALSSGHLTHS